MAEFYSHDPEKRWVELKEELYARLQQQEKYYQYLKKYEVFDAYDGGRNDGAQNEVLEEISFLRELIDKMERS